eukprot:gene2557-3167_t
MTIGLKKIFILLIVLFKICQSIENIKISHGLHEKLYKHHHSSADISQLQQSKLWVFFNTKDYNQDGHISKLKKMSSLIKGDINHSQLMLSLSGIDESSIKRRRLKSDNPQLLVDESDLPVQQSLIDAVLKCSDDKNVIQLVQQSKWLNSISISISFEDKNSLQEKIQCISSLPFVEKIDQVQKFFKKSKQQPDFIEDHHEEQQPKSEKKYHLGPASPQKEIQLPFVERMVRSDQIDSVGDTPESFYGNTYQGLVQAGIPNVQQSPNQVFDGNGVTILMMDSGYMKSHEAFKQMKIKDEYDFINNKKDTQGPLGDNQNKHGTATLSTIGGYVPGKLIGPAYNATFLLAKTEDTSMENIIEEDHWIRALEWGEGLGAELVSSSLGYTEWYTYPDMNANVARITKMADKAVERGMVIVVSAGNSGKDGIGAPADGKNVIAVGAVTPQGVNTYFSSLGPSADGRVKPDIAALGLENFVAFHVGDYNYTKMSGTSFACPLAAGGIALLMQAHPDWTPRQVYEAVTATAGNNGSPNIMTGYGIINIGAAFEYQPKNSASTCEELKCSGHGGCCQGSSTCTCAADRYGPFCEYSRVRCSVECVSRGGKCVTDKFGFDFICVKVNSTGPETSEQTSMSKVDVCDACDSTRDGCGVCGGNGKSCQGCDGVAFSNKRIDSCGVCGGNGSCKTIVIIPNDPVATSKTKVLAISIGAFGAGLIAIASVVIYYKRQSIDLGLPFLKGYSPVGDMDQGPVEF